MNPTRYMVQVSHDEGVTWQDLPEVTAQPVSRNWLERYENAVAAVHSGRKHLATDVPAYFAAFEDECEWRNANSRNGARWRVQARA